MPLTPWKLGHSQCPGSHICWAKDPFSVPDYNNRATQRPVCGWRNKTGSILRECDGLKSPRRHTPRHVCGRVSRVHEVGEDLFLSMSSIIPWAVTQDWVKGEKEEATWVHSCLSSAWSTQIWKTSACHCCEMFHELYPQCHPTPMDGIHSNHGWK